MNDSTYQKGPVNEPLCEDAPPPKDEAPQFGAVDIVEAFTAMRHEWRGQTKESRALTEQIQAAVSNIQALETKLLSCVDDARAANSSSGDAAEARPLALLIVETDHQLTRAVAAITQWETSRRLRAETDAKAADRYFGAMNGLARWLARPLLTFIAEQREAQDSPGENPAVDGLNLVLARLRRVMREQGIERLEAIGREFDANTMHAIGTVATADFPSGHVAEQLSPAYCWQGCVLRFADVRVAQ